MNDENIRNGTRIFMDNRIILKVRETIGINVLGVHINVGICRGISGINVIVVNELDFHNNVDFQAYLITLTRSLLVVVLCKIDYLDPEADKRKMNFIMVVERYNNMIRIKMYDFNINELKTIYYIFLTSLYYKLNFFFLKFLKL